MFSVEFNVHTANEHTIRAIARECDQFDFSETSERVALEIEL